MCLPQLNMLADNQDEALFWGNEAIELAITMQKDIHCHSLINIGTIFLRVSDTEVKGEEMLNLSLSIALKNSFDEHVARAYSNLATAFVYARRDERAMSFFALGLKYCEDRDLEQLEQWEYYMQSNRVRALFETGRWIEAETLADYLSANIQGSGIVNINATVSLAKLNIRRGEFDKARALIKEAKLRAVPTPVKRNGLSPYSLPNWNWPGWEREISLEEIREAECTLFSDKSKSWHYPEFAYWLKKCGILKSENALTKYEGPFSLELEEAWSVAADSGKKLDVLLNKPLHCFSWMRGIKST
jgi:hypothetical protein